MASFPHSPNFAAVTLSHCVMLGSDPPPPHHHHFSASLMIRNGRLADLLPADPERFPGASRARKQAETWSPRTPDWNYGADIDLVRRPSWGGGQRNPLTERLR